jgi:Leucine-rich repeat (LRR) protein
VTEDEENHDQLGVLSGFRTASRQGFHDDLSPDEHYEPVFEQEVETPRARKASRPSLSDRAVESLHSIPTTPKERRERRRSSFFSAESPMGPPTRPGSSMSRASSISSRPGTSDGGFVVPPLPPLPSAKKTPATARQASRTAAGGFGFTPGGTRRSASSASTTRLQPSRTAVPQSPDLLSPSKPQALRSVSARPPKARPALGDALAPTQKREKPAVSSSNRNPVPSTVKSSSSVLREQIAAAKAAARKERENEAARPARNAPSQFDGAFDQDIAMDPFNQGPKDDKHIMRNRINNARMDGKLNIAAMGLKTIPPEVLSMYDAAVLEDSKVNWAEVVDLTKFIAADNEIEDIDVNVFPDKSFEEFNDEEDSQGNQFGGLELLDLHGNALSLVPIGLRRLERLTSLNLSHNKLDNSALEVISQIKPLKELKLGHNGISGHLPLSVAELPYLEVLELQANRLLALPEAISGLVNLRVLNVSHNQLTDLPMEALQQLPLQDLDASNNALLGSLFPLGSSAEHRTLRSLNVANNSLAALTFLEHFDLPLLQTLNVTNNHLAAMQPLHGCPGLITLSAGENKLSELPSGFTELTRLRHVNFSSNDLRMLPSGIANMESLESLVLAANPLQVKKYLTMQAADIKRDLRARLEPESINGELESATNHTSDDQGLGSEAPGMKWTLKPNGVLDLSGQGLTNVVQMDLAAFLEVNDVRQLLLQNNKITEILPALVLGPNVRVLDLSSNPLESSHLPDRLELPSLQELQLRNCSLTSLDQLLANLDAPKLHTLDVSANRLAGPVPVLREAFPHLTTFLARDNRFSDISVPALQGLGTVNLASNNIQTLPAEIGLLWHEGLKSFEVGSNAFRVPGYRVLEKGTEATLRWLRDRLPAAEEQAVEGGNGDEDAF